MGTAASDSAPGKPISVFLLDDHEIVRRGVRDMLEAEGDIKVIGEASGCRTGTASPSAARSAPGCRRSPA
jgi:two-component system response regulator DevR